MNDKINKKTKTSTDIWFTSFLVMEGFEVVDFVVVERGKGKYHFDISDEEWKKQKLEYNKSQVCKIKETQLSLRDMLY